MKYQVLDDSEGSIHGEVIFESDSRELVNEFYNNYESIGNNVAHIQRNPNWKRALTINAPKGA